VLPLKRCARLVFNPQAPAALRRLPRYVRDWRAWTRAGGGRLRLADAYPCLTDAVPHTPFDAHYLYQGAWLARHLARRRPPVHVDVGSDVGVVSVLSAFVPVLCLDYRPLTAHLAGLRAVRADLLRLPLATRAVPSLSCLHVLEHVGLGRYGDPLDPDGPTRAARELARVVAPGGALFLSVPVGRPRVCFNAHRVLAPEAVVELVRPLTLVEFAWVDDAGALRGPAAPAAAAGAEYACGLYHFVAP